MKKSGIVYLLSGANRVKARRAKIRIILSWLFIFLLFGGSIAVEQEVINLLPPQKEGGMPLMEALVKRHSVRSFSDSVLTEQQMSNLLWAAFGVNRPESNKRTAPSSRNQQEMDIYVCTAKGVFLYDALHHQLKVILNEDIRKITGTQDYVANAAVNLVYVADHTKSKSDDQVNRSKTSNINTGFIAQNVYLYCASEGLGCVVRGLVNREELTKKLNLNTNQEIIVAQTVGYEKK